MEGRRALENGQDRGVGAGGRTGSAEEDPEVAAAQRGTCSWRPAGVAHAHSDSPGSAGCCCPCLARKPLCLQTFISFIN